MPDLGGLVVEKSSSEEESGWIDIKKYGSAVVIVLLMMVVAAVAYYKQGADGFTSPDGVVARRHQNQVRSDTQVDADWNLKELERSVALLNHKSGAYA